ncbi:MAG: transcriptional regulator [Chloroflexi bacterium]|nr:MAG: transcriptional regulator [Chloroflexota bacterium]
MNQINTERAQKLGALIRQAREYARRDVSESAQVLGITPETYQKIETGEYPVSLPEIEALALFFKVPMGYFWGTEKLEEEQKVDYTNFVTLRHRVIGVLLRQLRLQARRSVADVAAELGVAESLINEYEAGLKPIPYLHLEKICAFLEIPVSYFVDDQHGPLGRHEAEQRLRKIFASLPPEMQAFLCNPTNVTYLETAKKLSEMDVQKLRQVAESILDITF